MAELINYAHGGQLTPDAVSRELMRLMFLRSPYGKIMKQIFRSAKDLSTGNDTRFQDVDSAIVMAIDLFEKNRTDTVRIPTVDRFTHTPVIGDPTLIGSGAALKFLQTVLHVIPVGGEFLVNNAPGNKLRTPHAINLVNESRNAIARWYSDIITDYISRAWFEGYPPPISLAAADISAHMMNGISETLNKGRRHNPNYWVANQAEITRSTTHTTDDANINTALAALDLDAAADTHFCANTLDIFGEFLRYKDVQKSGVIDNSEVWDIFITPEQRREAGNDDKIIASTRSAWMGHGTKDPSLMGTVLYYNGFRIIENSAVAMEVHEGCLRASTGAGADGYRVQYGPMDSDERYTYNSMWTKRSTDLADRNLKGAVVLTPGAMLSGMVGGIGDSYRVKETDDGRSIKLYTTQFFGCARNDKNRGTDFTSPDEIINQTSAVLVTNSPAL